MKKLLFLIPLLMSSLVYASAPSSTYTYISGNTILPNQVQTNENNIYSYLQTGVDTYRAGSITGASISNTAGITYGQLSLGGSILGSDISSSAALSIASLTTSGATTLSGTLNIGSTHQGDILYDNGTNIVRLIPGTAGKVLQTQGASANPQWSFPSGQLGAWTSESFGTIYQAATDGFVISYCHGNGEMIFYSDSSATPSTIRGKQDGTQAGFEFAISSLVKKNDYWEVTTSVTGDSVFFIPLGS